MMPEGDQVEAAAHRPAVAGTVWLPDGRPAEGAAVTVAEPATGLQVGTARTSPSGTFQVGLVAAGTYLLIVSAPGRRPAAELIAVAGGVARREVILFGAGVLAGVARTTGTGDPVSGAVVTLTDAHGQVVATAITDPGGGYRLDGLETGDYTLVGMATATEPVARAVTVPGHQDLTFSAPGYRITAVVTGPDGTPFAGALVTLSGNGGILGTAVSDGQGWVAFDGIPADSYTLAAEGWGPGVTIARAERGRVARADICLGVPSELYDYDQENWFVPAPRLSAVAR
jgi:hypothetical protein